MQTYAPFKINKRLFKACRFRNWAVLNSMNVVWFIQAWVTIFHTEFSQQWQQLKLVRDKIMQGLIC